MVVRLADDAGHGRRRSLKKFVVIFALAACAKEPAPSPELVAAREALQKREQKLTSFSLEAESTEKDTSARYSFKYAAPGLAWGRIGEQELAFDGKQLISIDHAAKTYTVMPQTELLHSVFSPFVPEGFRSPLLPSRNVIAKNVRHARAETAVELTTSPGDGITVTWVLRMPSGDFIEKRTVNGAHSGRLEVIMEQCDGVICVPTKLVETFDDQPLGKTVISDIEFNVKFDAATFSPKVPDGYQRTASVK